MVIGIKPDQIEAYKDLHTGSGVRDLLRQANIHNFSIFLHQLDDGKTTSSPTTKYTGDD
jgi:L-rhamnose mutarotase